MATVTVISEAVQMLELGRKRFEGLIQDKSFSRAVMENMEETRSRRERSNKQLLFGLEVKSDDQVSDKASGDNNNNKGNNNKGEPGTGEERAFEGGIQGRVGESDTGRSGLDSEKAGVPKSMGLSQTQSEKMYRIFSESDADNSGYLNLSEFQLLLNRLIQTRARTEAFALQSETDFCAWLASHFRDDEEEELAFGFHDGEVTVSFRQFCAIFARLSRSRIE
jgi:hypothetical protein